MGCGQCTRLANFCILRKSLCKLYSVNETLSLQNELTELEESRNGLTRTVESAYGIGMKNVPVLRWEMCAQHVFKEISPGDNHWHSYDRGCLADVAVWRTGMEERENEYQSNEIQI